MLSTNKLLLLLLLDVATVCWASWWSEGKLCGSKSLDRIDEDRIIYGGEMRPNQAPWFAGVTDKGDYGLAPLCGGVIISPWLVLSSANCLKLYHTSPDWIEVFVGVYDYKKTPQTRYDIGCIKPHPEWNSNNYKINNIALLIMASKIDLSGPAVRAACLPTSAFVDYSREEDNLKIMGHGFTKLKNGRLQKPYKLLAATVSGLSNKDCKNTFPKVDSNMLCTGAPSTYTNTHHGQQQRTCHSDAGGPVLDANDNVVGIISFSNENCRLNVPDVHIRVSKYLDFINQYGGYETDEQPTC